MWRIALCEALQNLSNFWAIKRGMLIVELLKILRMFKKNDSSETS